MKNAPASTVHSVTSFLINASSSKTNMDISPASKATEERTKSTLGIYRKTDAAMTPVTATKRIFAPESRPILAKDLDASASALTKARPPDSLSPVTKRMHPMMASPTPTIYGMNAGDTYQSLRTPDISRPRG